MESRYKIVISSRNLYKEIELAPNAQQLRVGTGTECDVRLHKDLFFEQVELVFVKNDGNWTVICSDNLYLTVGKGDIRKLMTKNLSHGDSFEVKYQNADNLVFDVDFLIDFDNGRTKYDRAIRVGTATTITIGAGSANIVLSSTYAKNDSIELVRQDDGYVLNIKHTTYGIYHNGKKATTGEVIKVGDFLSVADYFFYFKGELLWTESRSDIAIKSLTYYDLPERNSYPKFNRNTRVKIALSNEPVEVLDPPAKPQKPKSNIVTKLLPSMGMLLASGVMAFMGGTMIIMSLISCSMAILTTIITLRDNKKEFEQNSKARIEKYSSYIANKRAEIDAIRDDEKKALEEIYVSQDTETTRFDVFSPSLFDRTPEDEDFLCINLGTGDIDAKRVIKYKKQERLEIEDELQLYPEQISQEYRFVHDAPVVCDLKSVNAIGIVGDEAYRLDLLKNSVIDLAARQYFSDVRMVFVAESENASKIAWLRMLPHVYDETTKLRTIVTDNESKNIVFEYLYKELTIREQAKKQPNRIVVFFFDECGFKSHPISKFVDKAQQLGVTFVFFGSKVSDVPIGCGYVIEQDGSEGMLISAADRSHSIRFAYPRISNEKAKQIVDFLAPVYCEEISLEGTLTKSISMFEMLNILAVDDINLEARWAKSQVFKSMSAPIGVSKTGMVSLDLHDKAHGPHGLVAGTTGSGKSEILQTYILSMSTLFHPYEVAFVIIDFKGGGMVNQFKDLPHLLGAITNIDGKEIDRSLKSIKAELQKRQRLFADAEVNHIDKYIKKYKAGEVSIPLPHLILIVDEFAELKAEQPEFMKELISAARIGRSLGVHLILATQKPSGQVNEQIWSNSRFKLCLKVQSKEDSNEVLKSPLAAEIKEPGRAYLQVGNNEVFELFQSAYSGAPEKTDDSSVKEFTIHSLTSCGRRTPVYVQKRKKAEGVNATQLDAIVGYVANYCRNIGLERLPNICLPPLDDYLVIPNSLPDYTIDSLPLGIYDDPDSQYQGYAHFDLCNENTLIVGSAMTGKTNILQSIIRLVAEKCSPKEAVFYIADFGAMYLKNFEALHHVGGVVTISESEKFKNLFKLLNGEIQERKAKFLSCGLSSFAAYREAGYTDLPHIFFIIDNFSAFKEIYAEAYEDQFLYLTREGISCGISIIVTNAATSGFGYRYLSNFACRLAFKCNDSSEYMNVFDRCRMQPKDVPGRLLCKINKELYEMQSFIAFEGEKEFERSSAVKSFVEAINTQYPHDFARKIPAIPELLTFDYIDNNYSFRPRGYQYPIALDYANVDVVSIDLKVWNEFCIIGRETEKKMAVTNSIMSVIHRNVLVKPVKLFIIDSIERPLKGKKDLSYVERYTIDYSEIGSIFDEIMPDLEERHNLLMSGEVDQLAKCPEIIILINNKDAIEYISTTKQILELYSRMTKQFKALGVAFIFSDVEDAAVGYNGPELLKRFKESKKAIITGSLQEFKFCDLPSTAVRNNKSVNVGDCFVLNGSDVTRIKLAEEVSV